MKDLACNLAVLAVWHTSVLDAPDAPDTTVGCQLADVVYYYS